MRYYLQAEPGARIEGPLEESQIVSLARIGHIHEGAQIALEGESDWQPAAPLIESMVADADDRRRSRAAKRARPKRSARRVKARPWQVLAWMVLLVCGLGGAFFVHWVALPFWMLVAWAIDRPRYLCSACGNRVEQTSRQCPSCGKRLQG